MMRLIYSFTYCLFALPLPVFATACPFACLAGLLCTLSETSAKGPFLGTTKPAAPDLLHAPNFGPVDNFLMHACLKFNQKE